MPSSHQKTWLFGIFQNAPAIAFIGLLQTSGDLRLAAWTAAILSGLVLFGHAWQKIKHDPLTLGTNIFFLVITPSIKASYLMEFYHLGAFLEVHVNTGFFFTIFLIGCFLTLFTKEGFISVQSENRSTIVKYSTILLVATLVTIVWAQLYDGDRIVEIGIPLMILFGLKHLLIARLNDKSSTTGVGGMVILSASASSAFTEEI